MRREFDSTKEAAPGALQVKRGEVVKYHEDVISGHARQSAASLSSGQLYHNFSPPLPATSSRVQSQNQVFKGGRPFGVKYRQREKADNGPLTNSRPKQRIRKGAEDENLYPWPVLYLSCQPVECIKYLT